MPLLRWQQLNCGKSPRMTMLAILNQRSDLLEGCNIFYNPHTCFLINPPLHAVYQWKVNKLIFPNSTLRNKTKSSTVWLKKSRNPHLPTAAMHVMSISPVCPPFCLEKVLLTLTWYAVFIITANKSSFSLLKWLFHVGWGVWANRADTYAWGVFSIPKIQEHEGNFTKLLSENVWLTRSLPQQV